MQPFTQKIFFAACCSFFGANSHRKKILASLNSNTGAADNTREKAPMRMGLFGIAQVFFCIYSLFFAHREIFHRLLDTQQQETYFIFGVYFTHTRYLAVSNLLL